MGILGYPGNDDKNTDGYLADLSDIQDDGVQNVDLTDAFPESEELSFEQQAAAAADINEFGPAAVSGDANMMGQKPQQQAVPSSSGNSNILSYLLILVLIIAGIAAYIFVNKPFGEFGKPAQEQATGDYFYDQALNTGANETTSAPTAGAVQENNMATIDVVIDAQAPEKAPAQVAQKVETANVPDANQKESVEESKPMNAQEKALAKMKADEAKVAQVGLNNKNGEVVIPVLSGGRLDPFLPANSAIVSKVDVPKFDIIAPPTDIPEVDPKIDTLMGVKLSGIMYDDVRPSAILSIDGSEQLVHNGDFVMGYQVQKITKNKVVIKYGSNVFEVSAGQTLNSNGVNMNPVSSLSKQFGGVYSKNSGKVIEIN